MSEGFFEQLMKKFNPFDDNVMSAYHSAVCINWQGPSNTSMQYTVCGRLAMYQFFKTVPEMKITSVEKLKSRERTETEDNPLDVVALKCKITMAPDNTEHTMLTTAHIDKKEPVIYHQSFTVI